MKTCFSEGILIKQFGNSHFLRELPLLTNPLFLSKFFMTPPLYPNFKNKKPLPNFRGRKLWMYMLKNENVDSENKKFSRNAYSALKSLL